jgi:hypothetical protein
MKRLIPFVFTTLGVLLCVGLVTAYRSGLLAKAVERGREHAEAPLAAAPEGLAT